MNEFAENADGPIALSEHLNVAEVQTQARALSRLLDGTEGDIEISLHHIETVDSAGLQLIVAFAREAEKRGRTVRLCCPSDAFREAATLLGLWDELSTVCAAA